MSFFIANPMGGLKLLPELLRHEGCPPWFVHAVAGGGCTSTVLQLTIGDICETVGCDVVTLLCVQRGRVD